MRVDVRLSGIGGQGLQWIASTLAVAAVKFSGLHAAQSASYESATRGGYSRGDVVISDEIIDFPWLIAADVLVIMSHRSLNIDLPVLKPQGQLLLEGAIALDAKKFPGTTYRVPALEIGERTSKSALGAGPVMLGVLSHLMPWLHLDALERSIREQSPPRFIQQNLEAYAAGREFYEASIAASLTGDRRG